MKFNIWFHHGPKTWNLVQRFQKTVKLCRNLTSRKTFPLNNRTCEFIYIEIKCRSMFGILGPFFKTQRLLKSDSYTYAFTKYRRTRAATYSQSIQTFSTKLYGMLCLYMLTLCFFITTSSMIWYSFGLFFWRNQALK